MKGKIEQTEQWLLHGDCRLCRKNKYCTKACKAARERAHYMVRSVVNNSLGRLLSE